MIQQIINLLYRYPKAELKRFAQFGGYFSYKNMMHNRTLMEKASFNLPPVKSYANGLPLYFLTGKNYLYQTLFCIRSLSIYSKEAFNFNLVDDGSLSDSLMGQISKQLPGANVITRAAIEQNLKRILPESSYPVLRHKRKEYPHIKKLTDVHTLGGDGFKLVLDSDMLFWNEPVAIINWLKNPAKPLHMIDCTESYGYSQQLMKDLAGKKIPALLNVGAIGLNSAAINWANLENWIKILEEQEGKTYYLEQALSAMLIGNTPCEVLDKEKYMVNPGNDAITNSSGILHHYVDLSKKGYYNKAWRKFIVE